MGIPMDFEIFPMVNTYHQSFENENSCAQLIIFTIRTISQASLFTNITKILKTFLKIQDYTHTLLQKPAFVHKCFFNKPTKTPFGSHFLIIWLNGSLSIWGVENFISWKNRSCKKLRKKNGIYWRYIFAIR